MRGAEGVGEEWEGSGGLGWGRWGTGYAQSLAVGRGQIKAVGGPGTGTHLWLRSRRTRALAMTPTSALGARWK